MVHGRLLHAPRGLGPRAALQVLVARGDEIGRARVDARRLLVEPGREHRRRGQAQRDAERLLLVADQVVPAGGGSIFGEWSLVDAELAFMLHRLLLSGDPLPERLDAYARAQWARPSAREFVDHARPAAVPETYWAASGTARPF